MHEAQGGIRKHHTAERIEEYIRILREWLSRNVWPKKKRNAGYKVVDSYCLKEETDENGIASTKLMRLCGKDKKQMKLVIPNEEIFDCIGDAHRSVNHSKKKITYDEVNKQRNVYSVTEDDVQNYVKTCPVCLALAQMESQKCIQTEVEEQPPVVSTTSFGDKFELQLIDFKENPGIAFNGQQFPWLMSLKHINTGKVYLRPLTSNSEEETNEEVSHILGYLGITIPLISKTRDIVLKSVNRPIQQTKEILYRITKVNRELSLIHI